MAQYKSNKLTIEPTQSMLVRIKFILLIVNISFDSGSFSINFKIQIRSVSAPRYYQITQQQREY